MWELIKTKFKLYEDKDFFTEEGILSVGVTMFSNKKTGEIKLFFSFMVEKVGIDNILKELNHAE